MTILNNLNLQPIDSDEAEARKSQISLDDTIDVGRLESFLNEAVKDMQRDPIWDAGSKKENK